MNLPKIEASTVENVINEAYDNPFVYSIDKINILKDENVLLYTAIRKMILDLFPDKSDRGQATLIAMVALNIVNTQMEINELREMFAE